MLVDYSRLLHVLCVIFRITGVQNAIIKSYEKRILVKLLLYSTSGVHYPTYALTWGV